jgi:hypothetical protein
MQALSEAVCVGCGRRFKTTAPDTTVSAASPLPEPSPRIATESPKPITGENSGAAPVGDKYTNTAVALVLIIVGLFAWQYFGDSRRSAEDPPRTTAAPTRRIPPSPPAAAPSATLPPAASAAKPEPRRIPKRHTKTPQNFTAKSEAPVEALRSRSVAPGVSPAVQPAIEGEQVHGWCEENGTCYGDISERTGRPKTVDVSGYYRKDGTYVRGHFRSPPRGR